MSFRSFAYVLGAIYVVCFAAAFLIGMLGVPRLRGTSRETARPQPAPHRSPTRTILPGSPQRRPAV